MTELKIVFAPLSKLTNELERVCTTYFGFTDDVKHQVDNFINSLRYDLHCVIEYPYVDKIYRDSYYTYFASKHNKYQRDTIRVSLFSTEVNENDFFSDLDKKKIIDSYLGYFVLRPTSPAILGRSVINKNALRDCEFICCESEFQSTCIGLKLSVIGFPYSAQDRETLTCAETSLWATMEYFGNKYPDYKPVLPSTIIETLKNISFERQLPSKGLTYGDLSFALKQFGFGTRIYSRNVFKEELDVLIGCYVESGIPIIIAMSNKDGSVNHAIVCVGRESFTTTDLHNITTDAPDSCISQSKIIGFHTIKKRYIFVDDNHFPYQKAYLDSPASYYNNTNWSTCLITHFITPLYPKIYLEAYEARNYFYQIINRFDIAGTTNSLITRVYLASSRSYKNFILHDKSVSKQLREHIAKQAMPKFIWVCEMTNPELVKKKKCLGNIVLDATETRTRGFYPLLYILKTNTFIKKDKKNMLYSDTITGNTKSYSMFYNNLNGF